MSRFPWRIFTRLVMVQGCLALLALGISGLLARHFFQEQFLAQVTSQLHDTMTSMSRDVDGWIMSKNRPYTLDWPHFCSSRAEGTNMRLTIVDHSGQVLCDSHHDPMTMENHADRPEILDAERAPAHFGSSLRMSKTMGESMLYAALEMPERHLSLRGSVPMARLERTLHVFNESLAFALAALAVLFTAFTFWSGRALVFPLGRLLARAGGGAATEKDSDRFSGESFGEWSELESSIEDIRKDLAAKSESLSREREELTTLMGAISDAILAVDPEGGPLFYNSRFALIFGSRWGDRKSWRIWEMFREPEVQAAFRAALQERRVGSVKAIQIDQDDGTKRFFSLSISPLGKESGEVYGAVGVFHDVTELKSAEQIRIDFVANVSHELRTPLTAIKGYTDTLIDDIARDQPVSREFLDIIARNVNRLMNLIADLLDLSSLESTDVLQKTQVMTDEITSRVLRQLKGSFDAKNQSVDVKINAAAVKADARRLEQVLVNLLDNASKYSPAGSRINVVWDERGAETLLRISDNGPGIPHEHHARLFERFYRVDKARSREQGGTGLGLAIVKHILQRHDGSVSVESRMGEGSTFVCKFPP